MKFYKGQQKPPGSGRKKGQKKRMPRVAERLAELGINPVNEVLAIIPKLEPEDQLKAWLELHSYCQGRARAKEEPEMPDEEDEGNDPIDKLSEAQLLRLVRMPGDANSNIQIENLSKEEEK